LFRLSQHVLEVGGTSSAVVDIDDAPLHKDFVRMYLRPYASLPSPWAAAFAADHLCAGGRRMGCCTFAKRASTVVTTAAVPDEMKMPKTVHYPVCCGALCRRVGKLLLAMQGRLKSIWCQLVKRYSDKGKIGNACSSDLLFAHEVLPRRRGVHRLLCACGGGVWQAYW
jgi:hypothetical protein